MQLLRDVAQQARFAAMQPGQISQHHRDQDVDLQAFEHAACLADKARMFRMWKREQVPGFPAGRCEARAREAEARVREIALQSEIILQRRAEAAQADQAMLGIMLGVAS